MSDIFEDSEIEKLDITKKNWATVAVALKKNNADMSALRAEFDNLSNQFVALLLRVQEIDRQYTEAISRGAGGGPTAE